MVRSSSTRASSDSCLPDGSEGSGSASLPVPGAGRGKRDHGSIGRSMPSDRGMAGEGEELVEQRARRKKADGPEFQGRGGEGLPFPIFPPQK